MDKAESFVFYRSFFETAQLIEDEHDRMRLYEGLIHFGLEGEKPELPYPLNAILEQMTASVKAASDRYAAAKENGEKGGRPKKFIPPEEWQAYRKEHSQKETAEHFGISVDTLQRWEKTAKPQNLNINSNDNKNLNVNSNSNSNYQNKNNKAGTPEGLKGPPAPRPGTPGYEWVRDGIRYRITENSEVEELGPV
ncbi:MAG: helix-turn-helix domain-containing protein [Oscillospiraceae bacterium]|nr:helix-turn-helix domain-containing protein [Oscillospiraceae bacterium]